jgi:hypothetical protein
MDLGSILDFLPPLKRKVSPSLGMVIGLLFGFIGLPIYFRSWIDFFLPVLLEVFIAGLAGVLTGPGLIPICLAFQVLYGYLRAANSNKRQ